MRLLAWRAKNSMGSLGSSLRQISFSLLSRNCRLVGVGKSVACLYHKTMVRNCDTFNCSFVFPRVLIAITLSWSVLNSLVFFCTLSHSFSSCRCFLSATFFSTSGPNKNRSAATWSPAVYRLFELMASSAVWTRLSLFSSRFTPFLASSQILVSTIESICVPATVNCAH